MTYYDVISVWLMLEWVYSMRYPRSPGYPFCEYLLVHRCGWTTYLVEFKTMTKHTQQQSTIPTTQLQLLLVVNADIHCVQKKNTHSHFLSYLYLCSLVNSTTRSSPDISRRNAITRAENWRRPYYVRHITWMKTVQQISPLSCPWMKQWTCLRIVHSRDWYLRFAIHTLSGAYQKWMNGPAMQAETLVCLCNSNLCIY